MSHCYIICQHLSDPTEPEPFLQGDNVTAHTEEKKIYAMFRQCFCDRKINGGMWPPRSPDPKPRDFFMCAYKAYRNNPRTEDDLKESIQNTVYQFHQQNVDVQWCVPAE
jgi:hypothetical protein